MDNVKFLVKRAQNNDLSAFEELVRIYQNKIFALGMNLAGNRDDAQDLAQEAFFKAYRALGSFRNEADFGTWLYRITVNTWMNYRRKNTLPQPVSLDEPHLRDDGGEIWREVAAGSDDPLRTLEEKEFRGMVREALDRLSEEHRSVLVLREIEGYSYEEVSQMLGCTLGTVKSRLSRAREAMRRVIIEMRRQAGDTDPPGRKEGDGRWIAGKQQV